MHIYVLNDIILLILKGDNEMKDVILDTIIDSLRLLPFLFITLFIIQLIEHKMDGRSEGILKSSKKVGPLLGGFFGLIPQCGFSVMATNLYVSRVITLGTLISVYLATSDEMIPIFISHEASAGIILKILLIKFIIGTVWGFIIDRIITIKRSDSVNMEKLKEEHCHKGIFVESLVHTLKIFVFIFVISFILNVIMYAKGNEVLSNIFMNNKVFGVMLSSVIGMIPNCSASVLMCELYFNDVISFGSMMAGLLCGSGASLLVLFKENKRFKENVGIILILFLIGFASGLIIDLI